MTVMNKFFFFSVLASFVLLISCGKQQTDEERKAEIDRQVQQRLDAEHQAQQTALLAQQRADLDAREKALSEKETSANRAPMRAERSISEAPEHSGAQSYDMFYTRLERYGDWRETSDYGYVWQPREAQSRDWRPYTNGRWVYSDAGWTWVSEEPFGWATYHYGRWVRLSPLGWVWVPGDEWAPAWVSWRTSNDYVGWAPLPPEARFDRRKGILKWADSYYDIGPDQYCFVQQREFSSQRLEGAVIPVERNVTIVNQTTNVTNITYSNETVVNQGPNYDEIRAHSEQPIERYRLERHNDVNEEAPRAVVRGEVLEVIAPTITTQSTERPRTKQPILQVTVERDWASGNQPAEEQKARAKMKAEATAPSDAPPKKFVKPMTAANPPPATMKAEEPTPSATKNATAAPLISSGASQGVRRPGNLTTPIERSTLIPTLPSTARSTSPASRATSSPTSDRGMEKLQTEQQTPAATATPTDTYPDKSFKLPAAMATPSGKTSPIIEHPGQPLDLRPSGAMATPAGKNPVKQDLRISRKSPRPAPTSTTKDLAEPLNVPMVTGSRTAVPRPAEEHKAATTPGVNGPQPTPTPPPTTPSPAIP